MAGQDAYVVVVTYSRDANNHEMRKADTTASIHVHVASLPPWAHLVGLLMACTPVSVGGRTRQGTVRSGI